MTTVHRIHIISDSTGETIAAALRATVPMFDGARVSSRRHVMIRNKARLSEALEKVAREPGLVFHTVIEPELRAYLETGCRKIGVPVVAFLDPLLSVLERHFDQSAALRPGAQHAVNEEYYARMEALDFAMAHDDGSLSLRLQEAEVVLVGVSRTSKTPTCVYLAGRGVKAANIPLIPDREPPAELFDIAPGGPLIVGLTARPKRLADIRRNRMTALRHEGETEYAGIETVTREVREARRIMERLGCPVIDVTRRSIEETAAAIRELLEARRREPQP